MESYFGHVATVSDALKLLEAARAGMLKIYNRRLSNNERNTIKSGTVFIFDASKSGVQRWTDGLRWSASRLHGHFLTYSQKEVGSRSLIKRSLSVVTSDNRRYGLINYYYQDELHQLNYPTQDQRFHQFIIPKNYYYRRITQITPIANGLNYILTPLSGDSDSVTVQINSHHHNHQNQNQNQNLNSHSNLSFTSSPIPHPRTIVRSCSPLPSIRDLPYAHSSSAVFPSYHHPYWSSTSRSSPSLPHHHRRHHQLPYPLPPIITDVPTTNTVKPITLTEDQRQLRLIPLSL